MKMSQDGLNKIVRLLKNVLSGDTSNAMTISNNQYSSFYLNVFLEEAERNDNDAIGYDDFAEELWVRLEMNADEHPKEANEFMRTWEAWVDLYRYLKSNNKLK